MNDTLRYFSFYVGRRPSAIQVVGKTPMQKPPSPSHPVLPPSCTAPFSNAETIASGSIWKETPSLCSQCVYVSPESSITEAVVPPRLIPFPCSLGLHADSLQVSWARYTFHVLLSQGTNKNILYVATLSFPNSNNQHILSLHLRGRFSFFSQHTLRNYFLSQCITPRHHAVAHYFTP